MPKVSNERPYSYLKKVGAGNARVPSVNARANLKKEEEQKKKRIKRT